MIRHKINFSVRVRGRRELCHLLLTMLRAYLPRIRRFRLNWEFISWWRWKGKLIIQSICVISLPVHIALDQHLAPLSSVPKINLNSLEMLSKGMSKTINRLLSWLIKSDFHWIVSRRSTNIWRWDFLSCLTVNDSNLINNSFPLLSIDEPGDDQPFVANHAKTNTNLYLYQVSQNVNWNFSCVIKLRSHKLRTRQVVKFTWTRVSRLNMTLMAIIMQAMNYSSAEINSKKAPAS